MLIACFIKDHCLLCILNGTTQVDQSLYKYLSDKALSYLFCKNFCETFKGFLR